MKKLNFEKLSKSNFTVRLLEFAKDYETELDTDIYNDIVDWIIEEKSDLIKGFLRPKPLIGIYSTLLDRKKALYEELLTFYE